MMFSDEEIAAFEAAMTPKQLKVVNFFVGKTMGEAKKAGHNGTNPAMVRKLIIEKLVLITWGDMMASGEAAEYLDPAPQV